MNKNLPVVMIFATLNLAFGSAFEGFAQQLQPPIVGGYQEANKGDRDVVAAARFAVSRQVKKPSDRVSLISVERAERQVVKGTNYRLCLRVKKNGKTQDVATIVYQALNQRYSLIKYDLASCKIRN